MLFCKLPQLGLLHTACSNRGTVRTASCSTQVTMAPGIPSSQAFVVTRSLSPRGIQYTAAMTRGEVTQLDLHTDPQRVWVEYLDHLALNGAPPEMQGSSNEMEAGMAWAWEMCRLDALAKHAEHVRRLPDLLP